MIEAAGQPVADRARAGAGPHSWLRFPRTEENTQLQKAAQRRKALALCILHDRDKADIEAFESIKAARGDEEARKAAIYQEVRKRFESLSSAEQQQLLAEAAPKLKRRASAIEPEVAGQTGGRRRGGEQGRGAAATASPAPSPDTAAPRALWGQRLKNAVSSYLQEHRKRLTDEAKEAAPNGAKSQVTVEGRP